MYIYIVGHNVPFFLSGENMDFDEDEDIEESYKEKYGIRFNSNWDDITIIEKKAGKKTLYMNTGLSTEEFYSMMKTGLEMGTNYLEDCMIATGKRWGSKASVSPPRGAIL